MLPFITTKNRKITNNNNNIKINIYSKHGIVYESAFN